MDISRCCFAKDEKKFTKVYSRRAQPFFCSLNLSLGDIAVAVSVVIFLNSLLFGNTTLFLTNPRSGSDRSVCQYILHDKNRKKVLSIRVQLNPLFGRGIMTTFSVCVGHNQTHNRRNCKTGKHVPPSTIKFTAEISDSEIIFFGISRT